MSYIKINGIELKDVEYLEIKKQIKEIVPHKFSFGFDLVTIDYNILKLFFKKGQINEFSAFKNEMLKQRKHLCEYDNYSEEFYLHQKYFNKLFVHNINNDGISVELVSANPTCTNEC